jgi:tetratricopeptide (TPR) repeat protein
MRYGGALLNYFRQRNRGWIFSLCVAVCVVYLPFLGNPFIFDDTLFMRGDYVGHYTHDLFQFELRWLPYASLGWTYVLFADALPHAYHFGNMLLHMATVIALFYLLKQLLLAVIPDSKNEAQAARAAWFAALIFALHPVAVYAVGYVIQRSILMATLFVLLMQLAYLRGLLTGQRRWLLLTVMAYFFAVYSREHSVLAPVLLVAETILLRDQIRTSRWALLLTWGALIAITIHIVLLKQDIIGKPYEIYASALFAQQGIVASSPMLHLLSVLTQAGLFFKYLWLWLLPNPAWMSVDMRELFVSSLSQWQGWLGAACFVAYGGLAGRLLLRPRWMGLLGLGLLYPWLQFLVELTSIRVQEPFVLYRSYLWMPGLMLLLSLLIIKLPGRRTMLVMGLSALLMLPLAWNRLWVFGDNYRLWNDAALLLNSEQTPGADRIFYNRGIASSADKKPGESIADLERSVAINPQLGPIHYALGVEYLKASRYEEALAQFDIAIKTDPVNNKAYYAKGLTFKRMGDEVHAIQEMKKSCELNNMSACVIVSMAQSKTKK